MSRSSRATFTWITVVVAAAGGAALLALLAVASVLHVVARDLSTAIESVHAANEIERQLLIHQEAEGPVTRGAASAAIRRAVTDTTHLVQSPEEGRLVAELRGAVDAYLRPGAGTDELARALEKAHQLSALNVEQARVARTRVAVWDWMSTAGVSLAAATERPEPGWTGSLGAPEPQPA